MVSLKEVVKDKLKKVGLKGDILKIPYYWIPYNFFKGTAFPPISINIELTYRCNLLCQMCPQTSERKVMIASVDTELNTCTLKKLIDDLNKIGVKSITFTGGEPLLRKDIIELVSYVKNKKMNCILLTNGTLLTDSMAEQLVLTGLNSISVSIDGPKEIHDTVRGLNNSFDKSIEGVSFIQKYKNKFNKKYPEVVFACTISSLNQDSFSEILDIAKLVGVKSIIYGYMFYTSKEAINRTKEKIDISNSKPENQVLPDYLRQINIDLLISEINKCYKKSIAYGVDVKFMPPLKRDKEIIKRFYSIDKPYVNKCFYPWYASRVNPQGDIYPCSIGVKIGNIKDASFKRLWNSKRYIEFRKLLRREKLFPKCSKCCVLNYKIWSYLPSFY